MGRLKRWLRRWIEPEIVWQEQETIILPSELTISNEEYLKCCERLMTTNDGKLYMRVMQEKYFGALNLRCPMNLEPAQRSEWLSGRDMLLSVRKSMLTDLTENIDKLPDQKQKGGKLKPMTSIAARKRATDG